MFRLFAVTLTALVALVLVGCAQQPYEHVAAPDLVPVTSKGRFDRVLLPSDSDLPRFTRVNRGRDRKSTRLNSSHVAISYAVFCLKKKTQSHEKTLT